MFRTYVLGNSREMKTRPVPFLVLAAFAWVAMGAPLPDSATDAEQPDEADLDIHRTAAGRFAGSVFVEPWSIQPGSVAVDPGFGHVESRSVVLEGRSTPKLVVREHLQMRDDIEFMSRLSPQRQRVAVRSVTYRGLPVLYPPYHWITDGIRSKTLEEVAAGGGVILWRC